MKEEILYCISGVVIFCICAISYATYSEEDSPKQRKVEIQTEEETSLAQQETRVLPNRTEFDRLATSSSAIGKFLNTIQEIEQLLEITTDPDTINTLTNEIDRQLHLMVAFLQFLGHPNVEDMMTVCDILSQTNHPLELLANQWLYIARLVWKYDEEAIMLPWYEFDMSRKDRLNGKERHEYLYRPPHVRQRFKAYG